MNETWLPVPGYEGYYEVSDQANVRSLDRIVRHGANGHRLRRGAALKKQPSTFGHPVVYLSKDGVRKYFGVHQLVLLAFVGPRPEGMVSRHLDGNEKDSRLCNLAYGTQSENALDTVRHGRNPQTRKTHCPKGHRLSGENLYLTKKGRTRRCLTCKREAGRATEERKRRKQGVTGLPKTHCAQGHPFSGENLYIMSSGQRGCRICRGIFQRRYEARRKARLEAVT
jgi:hypothetical protein